MFKDVIRTAKLFMYVQELLQPQDHRMSKVGRDLCSPSGPASLPKQRHPKKGAQAHIKAVFEDLQEDSTTFLSNLCQCSVTRTVQKCFLVFRGNVPCSCLCPLSLVLASGTTERSLALCPLHFSFRYLQTLMRTPFSLLLSRLKSPISLSLSSEKR